MVEPEIPSCTDVVLGFPKQEEEDIHAKHIENHEEVNKDVCSFLKAYPIVSIVMACQNHCSNAEWRAATAAGKTLTVQACTKRDLVASPFLPVSPPKECLLTPKWKRGLNIGLSRESQFSAFLLPS